MSNRCWVSFGLGSELGYQFSATIFALGLHFSSSLRDPKR
jgi:hypothetical protein